MSGEQREGIKATQRTILWNPERKRKGSHHENSFLNAFLVKRCSQKWVYVLSQPARHTRQVRNSISLRVMQYITQMKIVFTPTPEKSCFINFLFLMQCVQYDLLLYQLINSVNCHYQILQKQGKDLQSTEPDYRHMYELRASSQEQGRAICVYFQCGKWDLVESQRSQVAGLSLNMIIFKLCLSLSNNEVGDTT